MKILLVSATELELTATEKAFSVDLGHEIEILVTGVGMLATSFALGRAFAVAKYDLAINIGIAGSFDREIELGEVVEVTQDQFSEEIIEDGEELKTYSEIGLRKKDDFPFTDGLLYSSFQIPHSILKKVNGITVNTVHGNEANIQAIEKRLSPQTESMEGAAFLFACNSSNVPCLQLRAISNYVEKRNRANWKIELALNNLAKEFKTILKQL